MKTGCLVVDIGEDGALGTFSVDKGGRESDFLAQTEGRIVLTENSEHTM
jgi:hypothetical protein